MSGRQPTIIRPSKPDYGHLTDWETSQEVRQVLISAKSSSWWRGLVSFWDQCLSPLSCQFW